MTDEKPDGGNGGAPGRSARGAEKARRREERLAKALRDNLRRRKAQARGREEGGKTPENDRKD